MLRPVFDRKTSETFLRSGITSRCVFSDAYLPFIFHTNVFTINRISLYRSNNPNDFGMFAQSHLLAFCVRPF